MSGTTSSPARPADPPAFVFVRSRPRSRARELYLVLLFTDQRYVNRVSAGADRRPPSVTRPPAAGRSPFRAPVHIACTRW